MLDFLAEISTVDPRFNLPNDDPMKCVIEGPKHNTDPGEWKGAVFDHYKNVLKKNYRLLSPPFETYTRLGDNKTSSQVPFVTFFTKTLHQKFMGDNIGERLDRMKSLLLNIGEWASLHCEFIPETFDVIEGLIHEALSLACAIQFFLNFLKCCTIADRHHFFRRVHYMVKDNSIASDKEVQNAIDYTESALRRSRYDRAHAIYRETRRLQLKAARNRGILPSTYYITSKDLSREIDPFAGGGFADVYKGKLNGEPVVLKKVKWYLNQGSMEKVRKEVCKEAFIWRNLDHENIMKLYGVYKEEYSPVLLVSPWMRNGNLQTFLTRSPEVDRVSILFSIASGLHYLHSQNPPVIHGDIKSTNILIDDEFKPRLTDFGLARVVDTLGSTTRSATEQGTRRWMAPEVLFQSKYGGDGKHTIHSDIYAFGMTGLEIFTDRVPYFHLNETSFLTMMLNGFEHPPRPGEEGTARGLTDKIWILFTRCWAAVPTDRPDSFYFRSLL